MISKSGLTDAPALGGIAVALALGFVTGYVYSTARTDKAEVLVADYTGTGPIEYFPARYQNQATDVEALPPQF